LGGVFSNSGTWLHAVTSSVLMLELTGSPFMVGVLNFANFVPILAFSLMGGVVADRLDRRKVVIACSLISAVLGSVITGLAIASRVTPAALVAISFLLGSCYSFAKPALSAMLPALVGREGLAHATAINTLQFTIGQVIGSTLSAVILVLSDASVAFGINTLTYLAPIAAMVALRHVSLQEGASKMAGLQSLREVGSFVVRRSGLLAIVGAIVLANGVVECLRTLSPVITDVELMMSAEEAGLLVGSIGAGSAVGALLFGRVSARLDRVWMIRLGFSLQAVGLVGAALAASLPLAMAASFVIGAGFSCLIPLLSAVMQERSPDVLRGRVMATFAMAHLGLRPVAALLAGALASMVGITATLVAFVFAAVGGLVAVRGGKALVDARWTELSQAQL
jgi:MFS family permease